MLAAGAALGLCAPSIASADSLADEATQQLSELGLTTLTGMPSGRTTYRTYDEYVADMNALAAAYPDQVVVKDAPYKSVQGRTIKYIELTNDVSAVGDGKPVFYNFGAIHGNETPAAEVSLEFAYDVLQTAKTNPKVAALLDKVRIIDMPVANPDGYEYRNASGALAPRRASCGPLSAIVPPATCASTGVDLNRNYPFGWGSNIGANFTSRGTGPGSEPEVQNTMEIIAKNQVVTLVSQHTNSRAIFYPGLDLAAGNVPDLDSVKSMAEGMAQGTNGGYTNVRRSAEDYETSGETTDWSYYATRGMPQTLELVGGGAGCPQSRPAYLECTTADYTGTPGPASTEAQTARFQNHPVRNALYYALVYSTLRGGYSQITGSAVPGATLKITKDFDLYTAPIRQNTNPVTFDPPQAIPTHLESSIVVPADGQFTWNVNPSVRPVGAFEADGEHMGPRGYFQESWTLTCTAPDGTVLGSTKVLVDKGDIASVSPCVDATVGGEVPATLSLTLGAPASFGAFTPGVDQTYTASTTANVITTAGDAALSYSVAGPLANGAFTLSEPVGVTLSKSAWDAPASNDPVTVDFSQHVGAAEALRTGTYATTVTFTLSTTTP